MYYSIIPPESTQIPMKQATRYSLERQTKDPDSCSLLQHYGKMQNVGVISQGTQTTSAQPPSCKIEKNPGISASQAYEFRENTEDRKEKSNIY